MSIGAMKCGTTWLADMLGFHPEVETVPIKEIHYLWEHYGDFPALSFQQRVRNMAYYAQRPEKSQDPNALRAMVDWLPRYVADPVDDAWLAGLFPNRGSHRYCADFSNLHAVLPPAAWTHARSLSDNLRILFTMRDPIARLWSHTRFQAELMGLIGNISDWTKAEFLNFMLEHGVMLRGQYTDTLEMLQIEFSPLEYKILFFEDLTTNPLAFLRKIECFLGLSSAHYPEQELWQPRNVSTAIDAPPSFLAAAGPFIEREIQRLKERGFSVHEKWSI
jgi:hypothetical protein